MIIDSEAESTANLSNECSRRALAKQEMSEEHDKYIQNVVNAIFLCFSKWKENCEVPEAKLLHLPVSAANKD